MTKSDENNENNTLIIKIKFFSLPHAENEESRTRIKFAKKKGNLMEWYELF